MKTLHNRLNRLKKEMGLNDAETLIISINDPTEGDAQTRVIPEHSSIPERVYQADIQIVIGEWDGPREKGG